MRNSKVTTSSCRENDLSRRGSVERIQFSLDCRGRIKLCHDRMEWHDVVSRELVESHLKKYGHHFLIEGKVAVFLRRIIINYLWSIRLCFFIISNNKNMYFFNFTCKYYTELCMWNIKKYWALRTWKVIKFAAPSRSAIALLRGYLKLQNSKSFNSCFYVYAIPICIFSNSQTTCWFNTLSVKCLFVARPRRFPRVAPRSPVDNLS